MTTSLPTEVISPLAGTDLTIGYDRRIISVGLDVQIPEGEFTVIVGPNACGKSTLLRALSRLLQPKAGSVLLDGNDIHRMRSKDVAKRLGLLPQSSIAPEGISVADLVARGRNPHQGLFRQWTAADEHAVTAALAATNTVDLADRLVDELSGGQRQRVWVAMALAQQTELLLLDEPTSFLDVAHQVELLELFGHLNAEGRTIVAVLHDLNQACRYGTHVIAMREGEIVAEGRPDEIITADLVSDVFGLDAVVVEDPVEGGPMVVPRRGPRPAAVAHSGDLR
ncbi:ABC transporter ATP-binding protein [Propionibacteriaceae bacterium Y1685]|uniref:ABC transporter ATP-binding protein n=1 Tax=Microlunatus sp. Y1700 TaxID=3418487 RepID=UPI003B7907AD